LFEVTSRLEIHHPGKLPEQKTVRAHPVEFAGVDFAKRFELGFQQFVTFEDRLAILLVLFFVCNLLGLLCVEPTSMITVDGGVAYKGIPRWVEIERDDATFMAFLSDLLDVLELPSPPEPNPGCQFCAYLADGLLLALAQIEGRAKADKLSVEEASRLLIAEKQPQVQFTTAGQIAGLAVFLASDTASNMQGTALVSDGGWTAQ